MSILPVPPSTPRETLERLSALNSDMNALQAEASALRAHLLSFAGAPPVQSPNGMSGTGASAG